MHVRQDSCVSVTKVVLLCIRRCSIAHAGGILAPETLASCDAKALGGAGLCAFT